MTETQPSGNRWEPTAPLAGPTLPPPPAYVAPSAPSSRRRVGRDEVRTALVSAAVAALVVLVACAAFAVGRATASGTEDGAPGNGQDGQNGQLGPGGQRGGFDLPQGSES